jgi:hypothetical protein
MISGLVVDDVAIIEGSMVWPKCRTRWNSNIQPFSFGTSSPQLNQYNISDWIWTLLLYIIWINQCRIKLFLFINWHKFFYKLRLVIEKQQIQSIISNFFLTIFSIIKSSFSSLMHETNFVKYYGKIGSERLFNYL